jgi:caa(3)-type oxidase subunit IV
MAHAATDHEHHGPSNPVTKWMAGVWSSWENLFGMIGLTGESRRVVAVFALLMVFTVLTWGAYWVDTQFGDNQVGATDLTIGLLIATAKATFVLAFFMHMIHEQRTVYRVMLFTAFFFVALLGLNTCAFLDTPPLAKPMISDNPYKAHEAHGKGHGDHGHGDHADHGGDPAQPHGASSPAHGDYDEATHGGHGKAQLSEEGYTDKIQPDEAEAGAVEPGGIVAPTATDPATDEPDAEESQ